jgi:hypothetical protein
LWPAAAPPARDPRDREADALRDPEKVAGFSLATARRCPALVKNSF